MSPDQCGFGRSLESLHPGDREVVEGFAALLAGEVAMVAATGEFVPLERAGEPGIVTRDSAGATRETPGGTP